MVDSYSYMQVASWIWSYQVETDQWSQIFSSLFLTYALLYGGSIMHVIPPCWKWTIFHWLIDISY